MADEHSDDTLISFSRNLVHSESLNHNRFLESVKHNIRTVTVEPLMIFYIVVVYVQSSVMGQYVYYRIQVDYNITQNESLAHVCKPDKNNTDEELTDRIQKLNAEYSMLIQLCSCLTTILTAPFYCVFSDRYGRKWLFLLPGIGVFLKSLFEIFIQVFHWPIYFFAITEGFYGLFGGFNFVIGLSYSYIADISTTKARTKRIAILGITMTIGALISSFVVGFWIKYAGYLSPYIFSGAVSILCLLYPILYLKENPKMHDSKSDKESPMKQFKRLFTIYWNRPKKQRALFVTLMIMFNFYYVAEMSTTTFTSTYLMSYPICMSSVEISIVSFINLASINIGVLVTVIVLRRWIRDLPLVEFCLLSGLAYALQMAFVTTKLHVYIASASNFLSFSAFPFIRGYLSKRMGPREQGALFGGLVLSETISGAITKVVVIYFYGATFKIFHGMVYLFLSSFSLIAIILTGIAIPLDKRVDEFGFSINKAPT